MSNGFYKVAVFVAKCDNGESVEGDNILLPLVETNYSEGACALPTTGTPLFHFATADVASVIVTSSASIPLNLAVPLYP